MELMWKGGYVEKQAHPQGRASVRFSFKSRGTAVSQFYSKMSISDVNSQQSLASPWLCGGSLLWKRQGTVE